MCLILIAIDRHPEFPVIIAANRDEFFNRPALPADFWPGKGRILAGKDLGAGGTWLGTTSEGRFAALTNYRDPYNMDKREKSRGMLPLNFLEGAQSPIQYIKEVAPADPDYNGYNLLLSNDLSRFYHYSNISRETTLLMPGIHGLSNHLLDTPWPKVETGKARLNHLIDQNRVNKEELFKMLYDKNQAADDELPSTGIGPEWERILSPMFIRAEGYGTRCSTVIKLDINGNLEFEERTFDPMDRIIHAGNYTFKIGQ